MCFVFPKCILSAIFSIDKYSSLFGFYGKFFDGLIGLLSLGGLYFLIINNVGTSNQHKLVSSESLLKIFLVSVFITILVGYFSIFGIWKKLPTFISSSLPPILTQRIFNPVSGSMEGLAVFLSIIIALLAGRCITSQRKISLTVHYLLVFLVLGLLIFINFESAWIVLLISCTVFLGIAIWTRMFRERINRLVLLIFLIIIAGFFWGLNKLEIIQPNLFPLPKEQILDQKTSWQIGFRTITADIKNGFLGSGIGTFFYDFTKFKPLEFNQTQLWQIRFDRAGSYIAELTATIGGLGILIYFFLVILILATSFIFLKTLSREDKEEKVIRFYHYFPIAFTLFALLVSEFVYYQNTVLAFTFWFILGLSVVNLNWEKQSEVSISLKKNPEFSLVLSTFLIISGLGMIGLYYFAYNIYLADTKYAEALRAGGSISEEKKIELLERAVKLNPYEAQYKIILARSYLEEALKEANKDPSKQNLNKITFSVSNAISYLKGGEVRKEEGGRIRTVRVRGATEISPNSVLTWEALGIVYREIHALVSGGQAIDWSIKSFEKAVEFEPANPVIQTELGKLYLLQGNTKKAREKFKRAKELKPNYLDAQLQEALLNEREGNIKEAIKEMEKLSLNYPFEPEVLFQLGRLYFNDNQTDKAISQFQRVINLAPFHSNALYSLGLAYAKKGEKDLALRMFKRVLELNPGNRDVQNKIEELEKK